MAKKKQGPEPRKPGRPKSAIGAFGYLLSLRGPEAWKVWLQKFANARGTPMADIFMEGAELLAEKERHPEPPPPWRLGGKDRKRPGDPPPKA